MILELDLQYFAKEGPGGEKTEEPTSKKKEDTRKEGKVAKSKEMSSGVQLIALFVILKFWVKTLWGCLENSMKKCRRTRLIGRERWFPLIIKFCLTV